MAKRILSLILALMIVICMSSCVRNTNSNDDEFLTETENNENRTGQVKGGILNLCIFEVDSINPLLTKNQSNLDVLRLMFDGLFDVLDDYSLKNSLCESFSVSEDGLSYSFAIRKGVKFHDGTELSAKDVNASFEFMIESGGPYSKRFDKVETTSADEMVWKVKLSSKVANFPALLDFPVIPSKDAKKDTTISDISYIPNGTGIYKVVNYKTTKELDLVINENHFSGKYPNIPDIKIAFVKDKSTAISMFENLYIDVLGEGVANPDEYTPKRKNIRTVLYPKNTLTFLGVNNQNPVLLNSLTRRAISLSVDKKALADESKTRVSIPADIPINPHSLYYSETIEKADYNKETAKTLLAEDDFYDSDGDGILEKDMYGESHIAKLDILVNSENETRINIAEKIKTYLEEVGIASEVVAVDFSTYTERINAKEYDLFVGSVNISQNNDLSFMFETDKNMFGFSSQRVDLCLSQLGVLSNNDVIKNVYADLCQCFTEDMPIVSLYFDNGRLLCNNKIKGEISPAQSNVFLNIHEWYIK